MATSAQPQAADLRRVPPASSPTDRVIGAKPAAVCRWIFGLLGAAPGDTLDDLFPGSGAVTKAWAAFTGHAAGPAQYRLKCGRRAVAGCACYPGPL